MEVVLVMCRPLSNTSLKGWFSYQDRESVKSMLTALLAGMVKLYTP